MSPLEPGIESLALEVAGRGARATVAFDADGTLWSGDIGEDLLRWLEATGRLPEPVQTGAYARYEDLFASDPPAAFAFCVQAMKGLKVEDVERWSAELFEASFRARVFPGMLRLLEVFRRAGAAIALVSASNAITVRAAAKAMGLEPGLVLAVEGRVDPQGRLTGRWCRP
jgi:phosphoserine phosphatase